MWYDFLLFARTKDQAKYFQSNSKTWLEKHLRLSLHLKNNLNIQPKQGVHILGHWIYPKNQVVVDSMMAHKMNKNLNPSNAATYKSMHIPNADDFL